MNQFQQGDVNARRVDIDVSDLEPKGDQVVRHGESGHTHVLEGDAQLFAKPDGSIVAQVGEGGATLDHEEHDEVEVPEGTWEMWGTNEYDYEEKERRKVVD